MSLPASIQVRGWVPQNRPARARSRRRDDGGQGKRRHVEQQARANTVIATLPVGFGAEGVALFAKVYVANSTSGSVSVIETSSHRRYARGPSGEPWL
jgi:DNA-binding beta-propeller fold protein YncE